MKRRTLAIWFAGSLVAATAALAMPVKTGTARASSTDTIQAGWSHISRSNGEVADLWLAVKDRCSATYLGERLLCDALSMLARAATRTFDSKMSANLGMPLPDGWDLITANNSPFIRSAHVELPLDLRSVLSFYRAALAESGWTESDGATIEADRVEIDFATPAGPASLRLTRQDGRTVADLSLRKSRVAMPGFLPKPQHGRLLLGNKTDHAAVFSINERTIRLAAHAGENLAGSDEAANQLPESGKLDLAPGRY